MALIAHSYATPLGRMTALLSEQGLCLLGFDPGTKRLARERAQVEEARGPVRRHGGTAVAAQLGRELAAYFAGRRRRFDVPLDLVGTRFQIAVRRALLAVPYGETISYAALALRVGRPDAVRAVGAAIGQNKIYLIVPCHRAIGSDGSLTGYGAGLARKRRLLALERTGVMPDAPDERADAERAPAPGRRVAPPVH